MAERRGSLTRRKAFQLGIATPIPFSTENDSKRAQQQLCQFPFLENYYH